MIRLLDFLVCDDVREEKSGKYTVVGVYTDGIIVGGRPGDDRVLPKMGLFVRVRVDADDPVPASFLLEAFSGKKRFFGVEGAIQKLSPHRTLTIAMSPTMVPMGASALTFSLSFKTGEHTQDIPVDDLPVTFEAD